MLLFVLTLSVSKGLTIQDTLPYFFVVIIVYMLNRVTRFLILFHVKHPVLITIITVLCIIGAYVSLWKVTDFFWLIFLLMVLLVSSLGLSFRINYFKKEKLQAINRYYRKGIFSRVFANKNVKVLFWIYMVFKAFILLFTSFAYYGKQEHLFGMEFYSWLFISTMIIFTYMGYNFFGINKNLFFTHAIRENHTLGLMKV